MSKTAISIFSFFLGCALILSWCFVHKHTEKDTVLQIEEQPEQTDLLLFDPVTGHVYKCFEREDGNYQLWLYPDGNLQVVYYIEKDGEKE